MCSYLGVAGEEPCLSTTPEAEKKVAMEVGGSGPGLGRALSAGLRLCTRAKRRSQVTPRGAPSSASMTAVTSPGQTCPLIPPPHSSQLLRASFTAALRCTHRTGHQGPLARL